MKKLRIGEVLQEQGYLNDEQINQALTYQKEHPDMRLGAILIKLGFISENQMLSALASRLSLQVVDISNLVISVDAVKIIPQVLAEKYNIIAIKVEGNTLTVVTNDPLNYYALEDIHSLAGKNIEVQLCEEVQIKKAIEYYYSEVSAHKAVETANEQHEEIEEIVIDDTADDAPIIQLLSSLIKRAYNAHASDIHIEPFEDKAYVRMRIDGLMSDYVTINKSVILPLIARIKIISNLDIAEKRVPQDGHFKTRVESETVNIRVSLVPTVFGEKCVMRLLANNVTIDNSGNFGMKEDDYKKVSKMIQSPHGIIYLTGPTGSGKTTTLYMILEAMAKNSINISTIEDPVEKNLARINQIQVNNVAGLTFGSGLRALLRQDPDIVMVGETRDSETASISVRAAITGHLVFSTLHTNSATDSIVRLQDMGVEKYLLASSLTGVISQRLVRKLCPNCSYEDEPTVVEKNYLPPHIKKIKRAKGCSHCNNIGYSGRTAIHEVLYVDSTVRKMITEGRSIDDIEKYAIEQQGMRLLKDAALELVETGVTSVDELLKVTFYD